MKPTLETPSPRTSRPASRSSAGAETATLSTSTARRGAWSRRQFITTLGGGLAVLAFLQPETRAQAESGGSGRGGGRGGNQRRPSELSAWLHIAADGAVTVFSGKTEVGQNVRTMLTQAVAEELPTPVSTIKFVLADTALCPFDAGTFGSLSTPQMVPQIRRVAATAREALLELAAKTWSVERATLTIANGKISHAASGRALGFGELTKGEKLVLNVSDSIALTPTNAWKIMGTSLPKVDGRSYLTGQHAYTADLRRPGMLHARILRPTAFGATLVSLQASAAEAMPGVTVVRDGNFVGVTAPTEHAAGQALAALRAEWKTSPQVSDRELFAHLKSSARNAPSTAASAAPGPASDSTAAATSNGPTRIRNTYTVAYIAHAPLEPRAALAEWQGEQLVVHTGTQRPWGVRGEIAQALNLPEERIRVIVPDTGSGYGGKHFGDGAVEAARLAAAVKKPVKLLWTREEEFTWAYFRPAGVMEIAAEADASTGKLTRWEHRNYNSGNAAIRALYDIPREQRIEEYHPAQTPLRQGSYRGLAGTANHFARETQIDELAHALKLDPLEFRLRNLKDERARAALTAAAEQFGWSKRAPNAGTGAGISLAFDKGGYLAVCAEVGIDRATGRVRVLRVVQSFECGAIVNPDHLKNQVEGCIVQGLGGALFEAIRFEEGRILNPRFSQYRVPRFSDLPKIEVVLLDRKDLPSAGGSEAPIEGIAPALGNAIFAATGQRLRALPLVPNGLKTG